jgi:glucose/arabinose dehydrogenase
MCAATLLSAGAVLAADQPEFRLFSSAVLHTVQVTSVSGDTQRLFAVDRLGLVRALNAQTGELILAGTNNGTVLDIAARLPLIGDGGLLSAAFPDDFNTSGVFYVYYNRKPDNANVLGRFRITPGTLTASPASEEIVLVTPHTIGHNGGWMGFSPTNGYLYLSLGDDGTSTAPDPLNRAQTTTGQVFNGKVLRLDVSPTAGDDFPADPNRNYRIPPTNPFVGTSNDAEIWSYGLRNPWRCGFDRATGDFWIADVGQETWEEVIYQPFNSPGGQNYGWKCMEGPLCTGYGGCTCNDPSIVPAMYVYGHDVGCSISGGAIYRGSTFPQFNGLYFYTDFCFPRVWTVRQSGGAFVETVNRSAELLPMGGPVNPVAICDDASGELYLLDVGGAIYKLLPPPPPPPFCVADFDGSGGTPDSTDIDAFFSAWLLGDPRADADLSGGTPDSTDIEFFFTLWLAGGC